jgi:hypothetical protein
MLEKLMQLIERLVMVLIMLALLPCLLGAIVRAIGTLDLLLVFGILGVVASLKRGGRPPSAGGRRMTSGALRTPLAPKEDE